MTHDEQGTAGERADQLAERIEAMLAAAEDAAAAIRAEAAAERETAERDAVRIRAEAQVEAERVRADARREARALVKRATDLVRRLDQSATAAAANGTPAASRLGSSEEARLMALQMAMAGRTRAEVESDLRHGLRVDAPEDILDDVFGKGTGGDQRIPWSRAAKGEAV